MGKTREECVAVLQSATDNFIEFSGVNKGLWRCTDDVIEKRGSVYAGRMVWKTELHPQEIGP